MSHYFDKPSFLKTGQPNLVFDWLHWLLAKTVTEIDIDCSALVKLPVAATRLIHVIYLLLITPPFWILVSLSNTSITITYLRLFWVKTRIPTLSLMPPSYLISSVIYYHYYYWSLLLSLLLLIIIIIYYHYCLLSLLLLIIIIIYYHYCLLSLLLLIIIIIIITIDHYYYHYYYWSLLLSIIIIVYYYYFIADVWYNQWTFLSAAQRLRQSRPPGGLDSQLRLLQLI